MKLATLKIPVSDLPDSIDFYSVVFSSEPIFSAEEYGWAQYDLDGLLVALYVPGKGGGARELGGSVDFQLVSSDLDAIKAVIDEKLYGTNAEIHSNADGTRSLEFRDIDGNGLKILG